MEATTRPSTWKILLAFSIIYLVWGSTFLAIRIGVRDLPPFLFAATRFLIAGFVLYTAMRLRGTPSPTTREWRSTSVMAVLVFVLDFGLVFWSERRVPSGIAAVMLATIPVFMTLGEIVVLRTQRLTVRLALALVLGIAGVMALVGRSTSLGGAPVDTAGAFALIVAAISWSVAASLSRKIPLPESKVMSSGAQMLAGGVSLTLVSAALGEFRRFHIQTVSREAWIALVYLIVAGSIVAYTAYVWLLHYEPPTKVGTYAYVNPVIAVVLGYFFAGEAIGLRTILGTLSVLVSVVVITTAGKKEPKEASVAAMQPSANTE